MTKTTPAGTVDECRTKQKCEFFSTKDRKRGENDTEEEKVGSQQRI